MPSPVHTNRSVPGFGLGLGRGRGRGRGRPPWLRSGALIALLVGGASFAQPAGTDAKPRVRRANVRSHTDDTAPDASAIPRRRDPPVVYAPTPRRARKADVIEGLVGWTMAALHAPFKDRRRRVPATKRPEPFGHTLRVGERFKFDLMVAGNTAGLAEAEVVELESDPRGGPPAGAPLIKLEGHARTSGIVSLFSTVTDDLTTMVDARTGAAVFSRNILHYEGMAPKKYKHRVTDAVYEGRGYVRLVDTKDGKAKTKIKQIPVDTFDPLAAMAWVRSLDLEAGERAKAHAIDGTTLLRIEVESRGPGQPSHLPSIATALGLGPEDLVELRGVLTRVDEYDQPIPGKRVYEMQAWVSADERRIPVMLESDMWVAAVRLVLTSYAPPPDQRSSSRSSTAERGPRPDAPMSTSE